MKTNTFIFFLFILLVSAFFFTCKTEAPVVDSLTIHNQTELDSILDNYVDNGFYPFIYARVENIDGAVLYEHSAMNPTFFPNEKIDGDSWIRIWSMSKIITISVALDLIEDGLLNFDDPVIKHIPEFKDLKVAVAEDGRSISEFGWEDKEGACPYQLVDNDSVMTVLHLINHEAGFYYATTGKSCIDDIAAENNLATSKNSQELIDRMAKMPLVQHPGTTSFYGTNTTVLGLVAERATGKSLKQLVEERVTTPMKISGLQYGLPAGAKLPPAFSGKDSILRIAHPGELDIFGPDVPDYDPTHELYLGGEGMVATADAYADFVRMLLKRGTLNGHRFLNKETVEDIYAPHTQLDNPYGYNGYNLWVSGDSMRINGGGDAGLWIGGGYEGTHFWADPKREIVGVIMSQMNFNSPGGYGRDDKFRGAIYKQFFADEKAKEDAQKK